MYGQRIVDEKVLEDPFMSIANIDITTLPLSADVSFSISVLSPGFLLRLCSAPAVTASVAGSTTTE